jgi:hypothetical protein
MNNKAGINVKMKDPPRIKGKDSSESIAELMTRKILLLLIMPEIPKTVPRRIPPWTIVRPDSICTTVWDEAPAELQEPVDEAAIGPPKTPHLKHGLARFPTFPMADAMAKMPIGRIATSAMSKDERSFSLCIGTSNSSSTAIFYLLGEVATFSNTRTQADYG